MELNEQDYKALLHIANTKCDSNCESCPYNCNKAYTKAFGPLPEDFPCFVGFALTVLDKFDEFLLEAKYGS